MKMRHSARTWFYAMLKEKLSKNFKIETKRIDNFKSQVNNFNTVLVL